MPGLVPGIHVEASARKNVDGRDKPGHDEGYLKQSREIRLPVAHLPRRRRHRADGAE
jgi:hypothetical protein